MAGSSPRMSQWRTHAGGWTFPGAWHECLLLSKFPELTPEFTIDSDLGIQKVETLRISDRIKLWMQMCTLKSGHAVPHRHRQS